MGRVKNKSLKRTLWSGAILAFLFANLTLFQNCDRSPIAFSNQYSKSNMSSGNGGNYDGKPNEGKYRRISPDFQCNDKKAVVGEITVSADGIVKKELDKKTCQEVETRLQQSDLTFAEYNPSVVTSGEGIYERVKSSESSPASVVPEVWCRSANSGIEEGLDVVIRTLQADPDSRSSMHQARIRNGVPVVEHSSLQSLQRSVSGSTVSYTKADFELKVTLSGDRVRAQAQLRINGSEHAMSCYLGGRMDARAPQAPLSCPVNYVRIPALVPYTQGEVCVAKYEAQDGAGVPVARATQPEARQGCQSLGSGYDLIGNSEWQAVARNIEGVAQNWSAGAVGQGDLNVGHSDNAPAGPLLPSGDDNDSCFGTGQTCSLAQWNDQRRTHRLSNNQVIWDFGGNLGEWTRDQNSQAFGPDDLISNVQNAAPYLSNAKDLFGPAGDYSASNTNRGLGFGYLNHNDGLVVRGAGYDEVNRGGVFQTSLWFNSTSRWDAVGYRCRYQP